MILINSNDKHLKTIAMNTSRLVRLTFKKDYYIFKEINVRHDDCSDLMCLQSHCAMHLAASHIVHYGSSSAGSANRITAQLESCLTVCVCVCAHACVSVC